MAEVVVALDVPTGREALALVARLPGLRWAKVGPVLFVREGPAVIRELVSRGVQVFLDMKWHDIPSTVGSAVAAARELGVGMATVHCLGGDVMLAAAREAAGDMPLVGVTVLTSHDAPHFERVVGRGVPDLGVETERLARMAVAAGLRGVVVAGHDVGLLRETLGTDPWLVVPGIRSAGDGQDDQTRAVTPVEAVRRGATHLVVGRPITRAADPRDAYRRILGEL